jgi:hypothetical protein
MIWRAVLLIFGLLCIMQTGVERALLTYPEQGAKLYFQCLQVRSLSLSKELKVYFY